MGRSLTCILAGLALATALLACSDVITDPGFSPLASEEYPNTGLFTPGSKLGYEPPSYAAEDAAVCEVDCEMGQCCDLSEDACSARCNRDPGSCAGLSKEGATAGRLDIEFSSASYGGKYAPDNCGAVWIEDTEGEYVATPEIWAGIRTRNLFVWIMRRCDDSPDVVSSATLVDHSKTHTVSWGGKASSGALVPDGSYVLNIEVTENELTTGRLAQYLFDWGGDGYTLTPEDRESVQHLSITFTPE